MTSRTAMQRLFLSVFLIFIGFLLMVPISKANQIILNESNQGTIDDVFVLSSQPTTNWNDVYIATQTAGGTNAKERSMIKFNGSLIPSTNISDVSLRLYQTTTTANRNITVYNNSNYSYWSETVTTWNTQQPSANISQMTNASLAAAGWMTWNVTNAVISRLATSDKNLTFVIKDDNESDTGGYYGVNWDSKSGATASHRPQLYVTYTAGADTTPPTFSNYNVNSTLAGNATNISVVISDETALSGFVWSTNNSGSWKNATWSSLSSGGTAYNITTLNSTVGMDVGVKFYANDSSNNWAIYNATITTTATGNQILINSCQNLTIASGSYAITSDIVDNSVDTCIGITANNVILDCQGHSISKGTTGSNGIVVQRGLPQSSTNVTIQNCKVTGFDTNDINFIGGGNVSLLNTNASSSTTILYLQDSNNDVIRNYSSVVTSSYGIATYRANYTLFDGIYLKSSGGTDTFCLYGGSFDILRNIQVNGTGNGPDITLGGGGGEGGINNYISNATLYGGRECIRMDDSYTTITNVTLEGCTNGASHGALYFQGATNSIFNNSRVINTPKAFDFDAGSDNNLIYNNLISTTTYLSGATSNKWNITNQIGARIYLANGTAIPGINISGNYWTNSGSNGPSDTCADANHDGFCDSSYTVSGSNIDYFPLSFNYSSSGGGSSASTVYLALNGTQTNMSVNLGTATNATGWVQSGNSTDSNIVLWWTFDECTGTTVNDRIGSHAGTFHENAQWNASGKYACAVNDSYVSTSDASDLKSFNAFTLEAWFYSNAVPVTEGYIISKDDGASNRVYFIQYLSTQQISFGAWNSTGDFASCNGGSANPNVWNYVALAYNGTNILGYLNGANVCTSGYLKAPIGDGNSIFATHIYQALRQYDLYGMVDEVRLWNIAKSSAWINARYSDTQSLPYQALYRNGVRVAYGNPSSEIGTIGGGSWNYTYQYFTDSWFTPSSATWWLNVSGATNASYFSANDSKTGSSISSFGVTLLNSTYSYYQSTPSGLVSIPLNSVPLNDIATIIFSGTGYNNSYYSHNFTDGIPLNLTGFMIPAGIDLCAKDQTTGSNIANFNVSISNSTATNTFTNQNCIVSYGYSSIPYGSDTITVTASGYQPSTYSVTNDQNTYSNITISMLTTSSGYYVRFHTYTSSYQVLPGVLVQEYLFSGGSWVLIGQTVSDSSGTASFFMSPTNNYQIISSKTGYQTGTFTVTPTQQDYSIYMAIQSTPITYPTYGAVTWNVYYSGGFYSDNTTIPINFTYCDYGNLTYSWGLVISYNGANIATQSKTTQCDSIFFNVNTTNRVGTITAMAWGNRSYGGNTTKYYYYTVFSPNITIGNSSTIINTLSNLGNVCSWVSASGLGHPATDIIGIIIILFAMAAFSKLPWHFMGASIFGLIMLGLLMSLCIITLYPGNDLYNWGTYFALWIIVLAGLYLWRGI